MMMMMMSHHSEAFTEDARRNNPWRMLDAYHQSTQTLNILRAFATGGYADISRLHAWNLDFVVSIMIIIDDHHHHDDDVEHQDVEVDDHHHLESSSWSFVRLPRGGMPTSRGFKPGTSTLW
jgi:hypothetical protein